MKKLIFTLLLLAITAFNLSVVAQQPLSFKITGAVETEIALDTDSLMHFASQKIDSVVILNHLGARKSVLTNLEVVLLRDVLSRAVIRVESPKQLSEFYFVGTATDGYKVVFSWNEVFNNPLGNSIFIVVRRDGKTPEQQPEGIAILSPTDSMTGRRYVKGLEKIVVKRVD